MRISINELKEGCILIEDVYSKTNKPIAAKKTVITNEVIEMLQAFLIKEVSVAETLVNGKPVSSLKQVQTVQGELKREVKKESSFMELFLLSALAYRKEFKSWQSGMPLNISNVRNIILPLIDKMDTTAASEIFSLYHLSTEEDYIFQHPIAVGIISAFIGRKIQMDKGQIVQLALGGCLCDAGMAKINPAILQKKGSLTMEEFLEIKKHPTYSYKMIQNISLLKESTKIAVFQHHERLDGTGYPLGDKSEKINTIAKIIAVADVFHAMTSQRQYRRKESPYKVLEMLKQEDFGKYDITAIDALATGIMTFSVESKVKLSDGQAAVILFNDEKAPTRPLVKITDTGEIINLVNHRQLFIEEVII